jgi:mannosyl-oligosaccharide glucosidase
LRPYEQHNNQRTPRVEVEKNAEPIEKPGLKNFELSCHAMALFTSLILLALTLYTTASTLVSNNASLLWGPYRPNHYLGIRPRVPESLLMGLMWGKLDEGEKSMSSTILSHSIPKTIPHANDNDQGLRHTIEKDDNMAGYGWTSYDSRIGGSQTIHDVENEIDLTTEFVKKYEGQEAGNWALRVRGTPRKGAEKGLKIQIVFYVGMEKMEGCAGCNLNATAEEKGTGDDKEIEEADIMVKHSGLGRAGIRLTKVKGQRRTKRAPVTGKHESMSVKSVNVTEDELWQSKCKQKLFLEGGHTPSCPFHASVDS